MNPITKLFSEIPDEELRQGILEIKEDGVTGIVRDGVVRKYAKKIGELTGNNMSIDLFMTEINILRQGALRWIQ